MHFIQVIHRHNTKKMVKTPTWDPLPLPHTHTLENLPGRTRLREGRSSAMTSDHLPGDHKQSYSSSPITNERSTSASFIASFSVRLAFMKGEMKTINIINKMVPIIHPLPLILMRVAGGWSLPSQHRLRDEAPRGRVISLSTAVVGQVNVNVNCDCFFHFM